jgi:hypothetical protein
VALKGDFAKLNRRIAQIERLGSPDGMKKLTDNLAEEAVSLILWGFQIETDPYGAKWKAKVFGDGRQVLVGNTTRLRRGYKRGIVRSDGRGFRVSPSVIYARYHQEGTGIYGPKKRKIVPKNGKVLGFYAEGYISKAAAARVRSQAGNKAVSKMKGSTLYFRSVKGCPKRMMVPRKGELPAAWGEAFIETTNEWFQQNFGKR